MVVGPNFFPTEFGATLRKQDRQFKLRAFVRENEENLETVEPVESVKILVV